jgi:hypothetical protein
MRNKRKPSNMTPPNVNNPTVKLMIVKRKKVQKRN